MNSKHLAAIALALAGTVAAGAAQAGNRADVQWAVTIGSPQIGVVVGSPAYEQRVYAPQVYAPRVYAQPVYDQPVYVVPRGRAYYPTSWQDADRDGIPNRYDRLYNPRWDVDGDGIPNRYDRRDNRRDGWHGGHRDDRGGPRSGR